MTSFDESIIDNLDKIIKDSQIIVNYDKTHQRVILTVLYQESKEIRNIKIDWGFIIYKYDYEIPAYSIGDIVFNNVTVYNRKEDYECPDIIEAISWECVGQIKYDGTKKTISLKNYTSASRGDEISYDFSMMNPELDFIQKGELIRMNYIWGPINLSLGMPTLEKIQSMRFWIDEREKANSINQKLLQLVAKSREQFRENNSGGVIPGTHT